MKTKPYILVRVEIFRENSHYVSICPELNVSSFGDTVEEAKHSLQEAVTLFLEECNRMGTLKSVLEEAGYSHITKPASQWFPPQPIGIEQVPVKLAH